MESFVDNLDRFILCYDIPVAFEDIIYMRVFQTCVVIMKYMKSHNILNSVETFRAFFDGCDPLIKDWYHRVENGYKTESLTSITLMDGLVQSLGGESLAEVGADGSLFLELTHVLEEFICAWIEKAILLARIQQYAVVTLTDLKTAMAESPFLSNFYGLFS